jgi:CHASE1-domain containing sensor protein
MITTRIAALIATMSLLGTVAPAAFAQNAALNEDDDVFVQENKAYVAQYSSQENKVKNDDGKQVGAIAASFNVQTADVDQDNTAEDNDDVDQVQVDICAHVFIGFIC